jgi:hypothetical protein
MSREAWNPLKLSVLWAYCKGAFLVLPLIFKSYLFLFCLNFDSHAMIHMQLNNKICFTSLHIGKFQFEHIIGLTVCFFQSL